MLPNTGLLPVSKMIRMSKPRFSRQVIDDIEQVIKSGMLREGPVTRRFEEGFRKRVNAHYACGVSSGTAALQLAIKSCVPPGSKVLVPAITFFASASAVIHSGCTPIFVDIDSDTFLMDIDDTWEKVDEDTRAVVSVHLFGNVVDYDGLLELSEEYNLCIVHDCAQALGSTYRGTELGEFDDICCYSFYPSKIITTGEGGMVTTNHEESDYKVSILKNHGESAKYYHTVLGYNYRTSEISSTLGLDQMTRLEETLVKRRRIAKYYDNVIGKIEGLESQKMTPNAESCYNYYTVQVDPTTSIDRDRLVEEMRNMNIETAVHYPCALSEQPALKEYVSESCLNAEKLSRRVFSIPIHPYLSDKETEYIVKVLQTFVESYL